MLNDTILAFSGIFVQCVLVIQCMYYTVVLAKFRTTNSYLKWSIVLFLFFVSITTLVSAIYSWLTLVGGYYQLATLINCVYLFLVVVTVSLTWNLCAAIIKHKLYSYIMLILWFISLIIYTITIIQASKEFVIVALYYCFVGFGMFVTFLIYFIRCFATNIIPGLIAVFIYIVATCMEQLGFKMEPLSLNAVAVLHIVMCISVAMLLNTFKFILLNSNEKKSLDRASK